MKKLLCATVALTIGFFAVADVVKNGNNVEVSGEGNTVSLDNPDLQIDVKPGATLTVEGKLPATIHAREATVKFSDWKDKVVFWLDAAATDSFTFEGNVGVLDGKEFPTVTHWHDCRGGEDRYAAWGSRGLTSCNPMLAQDDEGRPFVSFGKYVQYGRRMEFYREGNFDSKASVPIPFKFAAVVFGSQNGGGQTIISKLKRKETAIFPPTKDDPLYYLNVPMWLDGKAVSPLAGGQLNGQWQVITFDSGRYDLKVEGLGHPLFDEEQMHHGGQNYREIILLSSFPSEMERRSIERYLAEKWGTDTSAMPASDADVRLFGTGTLEVEEGILGLGGEFGGTVNLGEGATLRLTDAESAPSRPAPFGESVEDGIWFDPDQAGSIVTYSGAPEEYRAHSVYWLYNKREEFTPSQAYGLNAQSRTPFWAAEARGFGPQAKWIDYDSRKSLNQVGCTLRIGPNNTMDGKVFGFKTGFMVLDTSVGGGTPFLANTLGGGGEYLFKRELVERNIFLPTTQCKAFVTNAIVRLNGIDGAKPHLRPFNKRPELLSVAFSEGFPLRCLGSYENTNVVNRLIHGECIFYARALTEKERSDTEAYLMKKWLGLTPAGYGDPSAMTITGSGSVVLADRAEHPRFSADYSGSVTVSGSTLSFVLSRDETGRVGVDNPIVAGSFAAAPELVVRLEPAFAGKMNDGDCTLIDAGEWSAVPVAITLDTSNLTAWQTKKFSLAVEGGKLLLKIKKMGLSLYVR